jgi:GINS complex subunit 2
MEFFAEETIVTVTPSIDHPKLKFISGEFGPLFAGVDCQLPLWLAITLKKKGKCIIEIPEWMSVQRLEEYVARERSEPTFELLPFHYIEISLLLLTHCKEHIKNLDKVSALLEDLQNIRMDRAKLGMQAIAEKVRTGEAVPCVGLNGIACAEIQLLKPLFVRSMAMFDKLTKVEGEVNPGLSTARIYNPPPQPNPQNYDATLTNERPTNNLRKFRTKIG